MISIDKNDVKLIAKTLKSGGNIYHIARALGYSIAKTSRILNSLSKQNEKLRKYFEIKRIPLNITMGHIFIGGKHLAYGEDPKKFPIPILKRGDYVLITDEIIKNGQVYCEIALAEEMTEELYEFGIQKRPDDLSIEQVKQSEACCLKCHNLLRRCRCYDIVISRKFFADDDFLSGTVEHFRRSLIEEKNLSKSFIRRSRLQDIQITLDSKGNKVEKIVTFKTKRIVYRPGRWVGTQEKRALISVNYDWK